MPIKYFVTRHNGAILWARDAGIRARKIEQQNFDVSVVTPGDVVMGTLPVHLASEVVRRGGKYWHLSMEIPGDFRGTELSADQMRTFNARLEEYRVLPRGTKTSTKLDIETPTLANESRLVHVVIASQQIVPNLLPALNLQCDGVVILTSNDAAIKKSALLLRRILEEHFADRSDFFVIDYPLGDTDRYQNMVRHFCAARDKLLLTSVQVPLFVNITGGTKLMTLAAAEAFAGQAYLAYCNTARDQIECVDPPEQEPIALDYDAMTFPLYLYANRYAIKGVSGTRDTSPSLREMEERQELTGFLALNSAALIKCVVARGALQRSVDGQVWVKEAMGSANNGAGGVLGRLSQIGSGTEMRTRRKPGQRPVDEYHPYCRLVLPVRGDHATWVGLLQRFECANVLQITKLVKSDGECSIEWYFETPLCARYVGGTWAEEFTVLTARHVSSTLGLDPDATVHPGVRLMARSHVKTDDDGKLLNELDVTIYHKGRPLIIETKSAGVSLFDKAQDVLNKLDRLKSSASGPFGAAWLLSVYDLSRFGTEVLKRAEVYGITCHHGIEALRKLDVSIAGWLGFPYKRKTPPIWSNEVWKASPLAASIEARDEIRPRGSSGALKSTLREAGLGALKSVPKKPPGTGRGQKPAPPLA